MNVPPVRFAQDASLKVLDRRVLSITEAARAVRDPFQGYPHPDADLCCTRDETEPECCSVQLDAEDNAAIEKAMVGFKSLGLPLSSLDPSTFSLPTELADRLRVVSKSVHSGIGFGVVRGLKPEKYSKEENAIVYGGIASYIANFALVPALVASSYGISRYRLQETTPNDWSGGNIFNTVAAWEPSPLEFYCACGIWTVAVVLWSHQHRNNEHQDLVLAVGILSAICIGATSNMSLEQMGRQTMPWCVIVALFLSAIVRLVSSTRAGSEDLNARGLLRIPVLDNYEDLSALQL